MLRDPLIMVNWVWLIYIYWGVAYVMEQGCLILIILERETTVKVSVEF